LTSFEPLDEDEKLRERQDQDMLMQPKIIELGKPISRNISNDEKCENHGTGVIEVKGS